MKTRTPSSSCPGPRPTPPTRREMLRASANGFGLLALSALLADRARCATAVSAVAGPQPRLTQPWHTPRPHFRPRARNVIFCFMDGGVSHVDSFDPKPKLSEYDGRAFLDSRNPTAMGNRRWLGSPWT